MVIDPRHQDAEAPAFTERCEMSDNEHKTLCAHVEEELQVKNPQAYLKLIQPATHYCEGCGRSAAKAENVCKPKEIS